MRSRVTNSLQMTLGMARHGTSGDSIFGEASSPSPTETPVDACSRLALAVPRPGWPERVIGDRHGSREALPAPVPSPGRTRDPGMPFIVATGIECSAPVIRGGLRRDQLHL